MGIDQLVNTFKGNPAPLQAKVERDNKGQPPGKVPQDLEEALALQQIAELQHGAQNQQAMQAGGAQPSVVEKLRQMLGAMRAQSQPQVAQAGAQQMPAGVPARPVMAAHGGSIDQLTSNLGRHYAGGGIIAFTGGGRGEDKEPSKSSSSQFVQDISQLPQAFDDWKQRAREEDALKAEQERRMEQYRQDKLAAQQKTSLFNYLFGSPEREQEGQAKLAELSSTPVSSAAAKPQAVPDSETQKLRALAASRAQTGQNTNPALQPAMAQAPAAPKPNAGLPGAAGAAGAGGAARPETLDPTSLRGLLEANIRKEMGIDSDVERDKAVDWTRKTLGLDALLGEKEKRATAREALMKQAQASRTPEWVKGLQAASGPAVKGGIGMLLGQVGKGATAAREAYMAQDLEYAQELDRLRDAITDAKIKGNQEMVREGMAQYKEVDARRRAAANNAASLVQVDEQTRSREQIAKDNAAARAITQTAAVDQRNMANAINAVKNDEVINRLQKQAEELGKMPTQANKAEVNNILKQIDARQNAIYKKFKVLQDLDTMTPAPGAASPGGTRPPLSSFQR